MIIIEEEYINIDQTIITTFEKLIEHPYMVYSERDLVSLLYAELRQKDTVFTTTRIEGMELNRVHTEYPYCPNRL